MTRAWKRRLTGVLTAIGRGPRHWSPAFFFVYDVGIIAVLVMVGPFHPASFGGGQWLSYPIADVLPSVVPWAGALGGVCISLVGVAGYAKPSDWNPEVFGYWHLTRAALGAAFGSVAVLIVALLLQNVNTAAPTNGRYTHSGQAVLAVIAFVVGFREETFRSLVVRVVDIILGPSGNAGTAAGASIAPRRLDLGTVSIASGPVSAAAYITNAGSDSLTIGPDDITISGIGSELAAALPTSGTTVISPGDESTVTLTWTPTEPMALSATLRVKTPGAVLSVSIVGTAVS